MAYEYEDLFKQSSIPKKLVLEFDNGETFDNERIYSESMELTESICTTEELTFGSVESNCFKVTLSDTLTSHKGLWFNAYIILNNDDATKFQLGRYYVTEDKAQADHSKRDITAYDMLYQIVNTDVTTWYNGLTFPMTLKTFRTSFTTFLGITEVDAVLVNDSMSIEKTIEPEELSGSDVLSSYCELCGVFPNINREGKLEYITLPKSYDMDELYPKNDLYPQDNLYPLNSKAKHVYKSMYQTCTYDEYVTKAISKLQIRQEEGDVGAISGTGDNCYVIEDNILVYGKDATELNTIADNLYNLISKYTTYRPYSVKTIGNPCVNVGEGVRISTTYEIVVSVILSRTLKGIQGLRDTYSASGVEEYSEIVNDVRTSIIQLKSKTNILTRTVDETQSTLNDTANNLQSQITQTQESITSEVTRATESEGDLSSKITQTADSISAEVTRATTAEGTLSASITVNANAIKTKVEQGDVSSEISQESDKITITGNRFVLSATNCSISEDGTITATNCDLSGKITADSGTIGGFTLSSDGFYYGKTGIFDTSHDGVFVGKNGIEIGKKYSSNAYTPSITLSCDTGAITLNHNSVGTDTALYIHTYNGSYGSNSYAIKIESATASGYTHVFNNGLYVHSDSNNYAKIDKDGVYSYKSGSKVAQLDSSSLIAPSATINGDISSTGSITANSNIISKSQLSASNGVYYYNGSSSSERIKFDSSGLQLGANGNKIGFFGDSGSTKKSVGNLTSTATLDNLKSKLNDLIDALQAYNLIS